MFGPVVVENPIGNMVSMKGIGEDDEWKNYPVNFILLYSVMMNLNCMIDSSESTFYYKKGDSINEQYSDFQHRVFGMFVDYSLMVMHEVITSAIPQNLSYIGTSLINVRRDYSFDSNDSFTNLIKRYFVAQRTYRNSREKGVLGTKNFISKWVRKLGIGYSVSIEVSNSGSSFVVRIFKDKDDKVGYILAEEGYGIAQIITLLIRIETAILESKKNVDVDDHELPFCTFSESTIAVEEPEVHLHPRYQSILAEIFVDAYKNYNVHFIIETHSEYLIRKLQVMVADKESNLSSNDVALYYVDKNVNGAAAPRKIEIREDGGLNNSFGTGFYDEADILAMDLFRKKAILS